MPMTTPSPAIPREKLIQHDDRDSGILPLTEYLQLFNIYLRIQFLIQIMILEPVYDVLNKMLGIG